MVANYSQYTEAQNTVHATVKQCVNLVIFVLAAHININIVVLISIHQNQHFNIWWETYYAKQEIENE